MLRTLTSVRCASRRTRRATTITATRRRKRRITGLRCHFGFCPRCSLCSSTLDLRHSSPWPWWKLFCSLGSLPSACRMSPFRSPSCTCHSVLGHGDAVLSSVNAVVKLFSVCPAGDAHDRQPCDLFMHGPTDRPQVHPDPPVTVSFTHDGDVQKSKI